MDEEGTRKIREAMVKTKKVKITININEDTLLELKKRSADTGIPYQALLNKLLGEVVNRGDGGRTYEYRIRQLEKDVALLKKKKSA